MKAKVTTNNTEIGRTIRDYYEKLNVSRLHNLEDMDEFPENHLLRLNREKSKTHLYAVYERLTLDLKTHRMKVKSWKNIFHANGNEKS